MRFAHAETLVQSARPYLFDAVERLWRIALETAEPPIEARAEARMAAWHAVMSSAKAVDLTYRAAGATALCASSPLERAFRDVHAIASISACTTGSWKRRVVFCSGWSPIRRCCEAGRMPE